ncbi:MAG: hypothetical protein U0900_07045 [Myxococcota bacterium]
MRIDAAGFGAAPFPFAGIAADFLAALFTDFAAAFFVACFAAFFATFFVAFFADDFVAEAFFAEAFFADDFNVDAFRAVAFFAPAPALFGPAFVLAFRDVLLLVFAFFFFTLAVPRFLVCALGSCRHVVSSAMLTQSVRGSRRGAGLRSVLGVEPRARIIVDQGAG